METSYNGWSAATAPKEFGGLDNRTVGGVKLAPGVRAGDVATVLFYVAEQFHKRVEKLETPGCWGFSYRKNRNANNLSCHASATAIDLNAPRHPNGKRGTFSKSQVAEIRAIQNEVQKVVRWGGDFTGTPDEMHFEIVASPATVALVAQRLRGQGSVGSPITTLPVQEDDMPTAQEVVAALLETRIARGDGTTVLVREALAHGSIVKTGMFDGGSSMPYGASLIRILDDIPRRMWATNVQRDGKQIPALQELADAKTMVGQLVGEVAGLASALADVQGGQPVDLAAVQAAARAGAAEAVAAGVTVTIDVPATRPAS